MGEPLWPTLGGIAALATAITAIYHVQICLARRRLHRRWQTTTARYRRQTGGDAR